MKPLPLLFLVLLGVAFCPTPLSSSPNFPFYITPGDTTHPYRVSVGYNMFGRERPWDVRVSIDVEATPELLDMSTFGIDVHDSLYHLIAKSSVAAEESWAGGRRFAILFRGGHEEWAEFVIQRHDTAAVRPYVVRLKEHLGDWRTK